MPNLINKELEYINQLFVEGLYFKALDSLEDFEQKRNLILEDRISSYLLKSNLFVNLGRYNDALKFADQACIMSQELGIKTLLIDSYIAKAWSLLQLRDHDSILQIISKSEELLKELIVKSQSEYAKRVALIKLIKSFDFYINRNIDKALEYGEEGLRVFEEYSNYKEIALALQLNSSYYFARGNLVRAIEYMERCLKIQRTYRKRDDWGTLRDLGVLKGIIGELDLALEYTKQSLVLAEEIGNKSFIAQCLNNSSLIYRQMGALDNAMEDLERNLTIWEEYGNKMRLIAGLDSLFIVSLDTNLLKQAEHYLKRMHEINKQLNSKLADVACRVNEALLLKMNKNLLDQEKAKEILKQIVEEEGISWEFTERALLHLCDIFLLELQTSNNQEALRELTPLINRLTEFAGSQQSYPLLAETNLLQGKVALIQMNLGEARQLFTKAECIADEHGLRLLARTISNEHDKLLEQLEKWEDLRKAEAPVSERLKYVEIDKTLNHMMGKQMIKPPTLIEEEPILLLIMSEGGNTYFNHTFKKDWDYSNLFSSFISAFNDFSSEIFSKTIDRIKIGENIIFIKPIEPFLVCYVSKGQSYPAIKKLKELSNIIKSKSEIWEKLNKAARTSQELNVNTLPLLGAIVNEIFPH
ncbi:MAG: tetratricopeptide repeat protein [Promethearchaeota archaeon]